MPNLAALHEAIAAALPDQEALVFGERHFKWRALTDRTRRLAAVLRGAGLGCRRERGGLANHESGQDHVGLYLYNRPARRIPVPGRPPPGRSSSTTASWKPTPRSP